MAEPYNPLMTKKVLIGAGEESTAGSAATVTTALAMVFTDYSCEAGEMMADGMRESNLGLIGKQSGERLGTLRFTMDLEYAGPFVSLLTMAGYKLDTGAYHPTRDMSARKTWTFKCWEDGRVKTLTGCCGNGTIRCAAGRRALATWEIQGVWNAPADAAMPTRPTITALPWTSASSALTIGGAAIPYTDEVTINLGATVARRLSAAATGGIAHMYVADIKPTIALNCEARLITNRDVYGLLLAGTQAAFSYQLTDGTHTLTFAAPKAQRASVAGGEREGIRLDSEVFDCCISADAGQDELSITAA